jgi:hypothetical protein
VVVVTSRVVGAAVASAPVVTGARATAGVVVGATVVEGAVLVGGVEVEAEAAGEVVDVDGAGDSVVGDGTVGDSAVVVVVTTATVWVAPDVSHAPDRAVSRSRERTPPILFIVVPCRPPWGRAEPIA